MKNNQAMTQLNEVSQFMDLGFQPPTSMTSHLISQSEVNDIAKDARVQIARMEPYIKGQGQWKKIFMLKE